MTSSSPSSFNPTIIKPNISWFKVFCSYFYLVTIKKIPSEINPGLCLQMEAGKLLLNTQNANYSYGNLHKVFETVFERIEIEKQTLHKVLILGLGTGSVLDILQRQYGFNPKITAVEIDPNVIDCLNYWDNLNLENTTILSGDAFNMINAFDETFDLIIIDLFIDMNVQTNIHSVEFLTKVKNICAADGTILINYIVATKEQKSNFKEFQITLMPLFKSIIGHDIMEINRVLELKS